LTIPDAEAKNAPASSRRAWATSFRNGGRHHLGIPGGIIPESPGGFLGIRRLPAPNGPIYLVMRLYWPRTTQPSILPAGEGTWQPPGVKRVS